MSRNDSRSVCAIDKALKLILVWKCQNRHQGQFLLALSDRKDHLPRMNFSKSLSRSESIIFVGGGLRTSFGLYVSLDLTFPTCRMYYKTKVSWGTFLALM